MGQRRDHARSGRPGRSVGNSRGVISCRGDRQPAPVPDPVGPLRRPAPATCRVLVRPRSLVGHGHSDADVGALRGPHAADRLPHLLLVDPGDDHSRRDPGATAEGSMTLATLYRRLDLAILVGVVVVVAGAVVYW